MKIYAFADEASPMIDGQIAAVQRNGLNGLEIRNVDNINVSDITVEKAREVRQKLDEAGLIVWSIGSPLGKIGIHDDFAAHLEKCRHTCEIANILGAKRIRMFSFYTPKGEDPYTYESEVVEKIAQMLQIAKQYDVYLCHENEKGIFGDNADRCRRLLDALPELKCVFDPANFIQCGQETLSAFALLKDRIDYLHVKDALADGSVVPAGKGIGNLSQIVAACKELGVNNLTIEPHLTVFSGLAALEQEGEQSKIGAYSYPDADTAFDAACTALRELL